MSSISATRSDFYTALSTCHKLQLFMGMADFRLEGPVGDRTLKIIKITSWYKLTFIAFVIAITLSFVLLNDFIAPFKSESEFYWFVAVYDLHCDYVFIVVLLMSSLWHRNCLIRSWHDIITADKLLHNFIPNINNTIIERFSKICIVVNLISDTLAHITTDDVLTHQEIKFFLLSNVLYWIINIYRLCTVTVFLSWMFSLKLRFQAIHEWIFNNEVFVTKKDVRQIQLLHQQLCEISTIINKVYSAPILISLSMNFFIVVFQMYEFLVLLTKLSPNWQQILNTFVYLLWESAEIILVVVICALVTKHEDLVKRRLFTLVNANANLRSEINSLSVQMLHFDTKATAAGFIDLDATLLFQIISGGITYLLIFLQFYNLNNTSVN